MESSVLIYFKDEIDQLYRLGNEINEAIYVSPHSAVVKGRIFAELLSKEIAKKEEEAELVSLIQVDRLKKLNEKGIIDNEINTAFYNIRRLGNTAAHDEIEGDLEAALHIHRNLYKIICWYIETYLDYEFEAQTYKTPERVQQDRSSEKLEELLEKFTKMMNDSKVTNNNIEKTEDKTGNNLDYKEKIEEIKEDEDTVCGVKLKDGDSAYIVYCKNELKKYFDEDEWVFSTGYGSIAAYNKRFQLEIGKINEKLAKELKFQIWMRRPEKEKVSLQIEVAGAGADYKDLRLALSNSFAKKLMKVDYIEIAKPNVGVVLTLKMDAINIVTKEDDNITNLEANKEHIKECVKRFSDYLSKYIINYWIDKEVGDITKSYFGMKVEAKQNPFLVVTTDEESLDNKSSKMKKMITQSERTNIESIERKVKRGQIVLNPEFQRNYVYTDDRASGIIQSILLNMPLGVIYLAEIDNKNLCVDGQQRLTSIIRYVNNEFPLKKLDVMAELNGKYFKDLEDNMIDEIYDYSMEVTKIKECTDEQVYFLYEKLNVGSVKLNEQEIRRCVYSGHFNSMLEKLVEEEDFKFFFGDIDNTRLQRVETLINALAISEKPNYKCSRKKLLNDYMEAHKDYSEKQTESERKEIIRVFRLIKDVLGDRAFKFKDIEGEKSHKVTNTLFYPTFNAFKNIDSKDICLNADKIREALVNLQQSDVCIFNPNGNVNGDAKGVKYSIDRINNIVLDCCNTDDKARLFPKEWKSILMDKQGGICGMCEQKILDINDTEIKHIKPCSEGGETTFENAQLAHRQCNRNKRNN
jgi:hypothetical protein